MHTEIKRTKLCIEINVIVLILLTLMRLISRCYHTVFSRYEDSNIDQSFLLCEVDPTLDPPPPKPNSRYTTD